jgi:hypothetical protein
MTYARRARVHTRTSGRRAQPNAHRTCTSRRRPQTATVQRQLCGPAPGLGACKATEVPEDVHAREAKFQRRMNRDEMDYQRRQWEVRAHVCWEFVPK